MNKQKEKAQELIDKFLKQSLWMYQAKGCALIAVDEIINSESDMFDEIYINTDKGDYHKKSHRYAYWLEVKREIELL